MNINSKSNKSIIIYLNTNENHPYAYKDKNYTIKYSKNELEKAFKNNRIICYLDDGTNKMNAFAHAMYSETNYSYLWLMSWNKIYSSEYIKASTS